uniref:Uncharacterized protein n=1 Tax=Apteryx owenii TaxID=8824 RepID=A0A8B9QCM6_APTOW
HTQTSPRDRTTRGRCYYTALEKPWVSAENGRKVGDTWMPAGPALHLRHAAQALASSKLSWTTLNCPNTASELARRGQDARPPPGRKDHGPCPSVPLEPGGIRTLLLNCSQRTTKGSCKILDDSTSQTPLRPFGMLRAHYGC